MATAAERKALGFFALAIALGAGVRFTRTPALSSSADSLGDSAFARHRSAVEAAAHRSRGVPSGRRGRRDRTSPTIDPGVPGRSSTDGGGSDARPVDVDRASASELEALPGIGPSLARRIVANRDSLGPFGAMDVLEAVKGVGPALVARIRPRVTFSAAPRPQHAISGAASKTTPGKRGARRRDPRP
jgi:competence ComEA-like helix-hairpin-helix protein